MKIEPGEEAPVPAASQPSRNKRLPQRFQEGDVWKTQVIPTIIKWAATQRHIFKIPLDRLAEVLQIVCRFYYGDNEIVFKPLDPTVGQVRPLSFVERLLIRSTGFTTPHGPI